MSASLVVTGLAKTFPPARRNGRRPVAAVRGVSFTVDAGSFFTIVGPSGCGKTTTLRCIAGLERPDEGHIELESRVLFSSAGRMHVPVNERRIGIVFQAYALWPHMTVFANVAFPLRVGPRRTRPPEREIHARVERALAAVRLDDLAGRTATDLSSGQQQRVALARALVVEPPLLLLDEPLSNIDAKLREHMRAELVRLQREVGVTTVYVTHDQVEALALSDTVAVMQDGVVEQVGTPREVYDDPASVFVADFVGSSNLLRGTVESVAVASSTILTKAGPLTVDGCPYVVGTEVVVAVRPERVVMCGDTVLRGSRGGPWEAGGPNRCRGVVESAAFLGDAVNHGVRVGGVELRVRVAVDAAVAVGTTVGLELPGDACRLLRDT